MFKTASGTTSCSVLNILWCHFSTVEPRHNDTPREQPNRIILVLEYRQAKHALFLTSIGDIQEIAHIARSLLMPSVCQYDFAAVLHDQAPGWGRPGEV